MTQKPKTALVLEGGAMRGMYTVGVLDVLMDEGVEVDLMVGVSAGALFGVNFLSGQRSRALRYNKRFNGNPNYMGLKPLLREGNIISTSFAYDDVAKKLDPFDDEAFMRNATPFYAVVTNMSTGMPEYIHIKSVFEQMDTLRASGSMPFVSTPVEIDGQLYLDGGISDSIPFEWAAAQGCEKIITIVTQDFDYEKQPMNPLLANTYKRKYPEVAQRLRDRHAQYNDSANLLKEWESAGRSFVFRPSEPIKMSRLEKDPNVLQAVYDLGIRDAQQRIAELRAYLSRP